MKTAIRKPVQARSQRTREDIFNAAREGFSRRGFHGTRVDDIAERAGVNKERIYAYFGNKRKLFVDVLRSAYEDIMQADRALLDMADDDIPHLPERLLRHYIRFHADHPHFWRLLSWENLEGGRHSEALHNIREPSFRTLRALYRKGQKRGCFHADVSFEAWILVLTSVSYFYFANLRTMSKTLGLDLGDEKIRTRLIDEALRMIRTPSEGKAT